MFEFISFKQYIKMAPLKTTKSTPFPVTTECKIFAFKTFFPQINHKPQPK